MATFGWFPNLAPSSPQTSLTPWQRLQQGYQQPAVPPQYQGYVQPTQQPQTTAPNQYPSTVPVRMLPDLTPMASTTRPPGTMPTTYAAPYQPPSEPGVPLPGTTGEDIPVRYPTYPNPAWPQPTPVIPPAVPPPSEPGVIPPETPGWLPPKPEPPVIPPVVPPPTEPGTGGGTLPPKGGDGGEEPEPKEPPVRPQPTSRWNPYWGPLDAPLMDLANVGLNTPGGFWIRPPWANRDRNIGRSPEINGSAPEFVQPIYIPEGVTFGEWLGMNPWFYNRSNPVPGSEGGYHEDYTPTNDLLLEDWLKELLADLAYKETDQYKWSPLRMNIQQYNNLRPNEKALWEGTWSAAGLAPADMWAMLLAAAPKGQAQTLTRWG